MTSLRPFRQQNIRLMATNKIVQEDHTGQAHGRRNARTTGNALDTVKGCPGARTNSGLGCPWGCYSVEALKRYKMDNGTPIVQVLNADLLRRDLANCPDNWIRIGVHGDPCEAWALTVETCRVIVECHKVPVVISRLWTLPDADTLQALASLGVVLHVSLCALDNDGFLGPRLKVLHDFAATGGRGVLRLVTFAWTDLALIERQDALALGGLPVLEQPARLIRTNPTFAQVDADAYHPYHNYTDGKPSTRWYTAGPLYQGLACVEGCPSCSHACYTVPDTTRTEAQDLAGKYQATS